MSEMFWQYTNAVIKILEDTYTPAGIMIWLASENRNLGGRPVELIHVGRHADVLAEARRVAGS